VCACGRESLVHVVLCVQVYLQCALLYTTTDGARRVRVSTLALPVSDQMGSVFKGADLDSQLATLTRQVSRAIHSKHTVVLSSCWSFASWEAAARLNATQPRETARDVQVGWLVWYAVVLCCC